MCLNPTLSSISDANTSFVVGKLQVIKHNHRKSACRKLGSEALEGENENVSENRNEGTEWNSFYYLEILTL